MTEPSNPSPFHVGERALQQRTGMRERLARVEHNLIRSFMPDQHREFFAQLPFLVIGSVDAQGWPRASIVVGEAGFVCSPDPQTLRVQGHVSHGDGLLQRLPPTAPVGLLGLQFETRRRNRANGFVLRNDAGMLELHITQSFGNCPKYIHPRTPRFVASPASIAGARDHHTYRGLLPLPPSALIERSDTFFIVTGTRNDAGAHDHTHNLDVSHRGGDPGFVRVGRLDGHTVLTWPDYAGNNFFNTLGNLTRDPRASLLFIDFDRGDWLCLSGQVEVTWEGPELSTFPDAQRIVRLRVQDALYAPEALPLRWS